MGPAEARFYRARATRKGESVRLDWAIDSAFRFFPVNADPEVGYRLHLADVAMNKVLALAGRNEARDLSMSSISIPPPYR